MTACELLRLKKGVPMEKRSAEKDLIGRTDEVQIGIVSDIKNCDGYPILCLGRQRKQRAFQGILWSYPVNRQVLSELIVRKVLEGSHKRLPERMVFDNGIDPFKERASERLFRPLLRTPAFDIL